MNANREGLLVRAMERAFDLEEEPNPIYLACNRHEVAHDPFEGSYYDDRLPSERGMMPSWEWWQ